MTPSRRKFLSILEKWVLGSLPVAALLGGLIFGWIISALSGGEELGLLANYRPSTPTRLYDRNGRVFAELFRHRQELIRLQDIPPQVIQAFLAVEDDNFFNHFGIDIMGIFRAAVKNVLAGEIVQGGSTLTQQVAKQIYLKAEGVRRRNVTQKIKETILALQIEEELSKEEILEVYFNVIYLGHGCRGLSCAAKMYFDKKAQDLSLAEAALLARLPKAPVSYSPFKNPREAMRQHRFTLRRMAATNFVHPEQIEAIHSAFWKEYWGRFIVRSPSQTRWSQKLDLAPFFTDHVRQLLEANEAVGPKRLYTQGLQVYTTLDLTHQKAAEAEVKEALAKANRYNRHYARTYGAGGVDHNLFQVYNTLAHILPIGHLRIEKMGQRESMRRHLKDNFLDFAQILTLLTPASNEAAALKEFRKDTHSFFTDLKIEGAFLNIEPRTGYITTMIGGSKFSPQNQYNRALMARRQPGSAFKIFVYGAALENRIISSRSALNDAPFHTIAPDGSTWTPVNYEEGFRGLVDATSALAKSLNICAVEVFFKTGPEPIINLSSRLMKITNPNRFTPDPALALGVSEITPMEMATALSIIANDGKDVIPFSIRYVADQSGNIIYNQEARIRRVLALKTEQNRIQVIEPGLAFILRDMMTTVSRGGTPAPYLREAGFHGDLASKTGTTSGWYDAWFVGFNPENASVVWFGYDKNMSMGPGGSGGPMAAPVLGAFYRRIYKDRDIPYPSFRDRKDGNKPPAGVYAGSCGGYSLPGKVIHGRKRFVTNTICAGDENRIYDMRRLLMEKMGIKPEDIGSDTRRVRFKRDRFFKN